MSTQINLHVRLITSDYRAADIVDNHADILKAALLDSVDRILRLHGLHNLFIQSIGGPEIVNLP